MKYMILLTLMSTSVWAKPLILITYYDAFNGAPFNNSERIAKALELRLNNINSPVEAKLCSLNTIFDKAYAQTEDCLKALSVAPVMVLGLGESTCQLKVESMMRNNDKTESPDNAGNRRRNSDIVRGAPEVLGMRYPLPQMYCGLSSAERNNIDVSNNAGSFVCNNTAYQMSYHYPEVQFGFIHVPANNCAGLARKSEAAVLTLEKMVVTGVAFLASESNSSDFPHTSNDSRLPTRKSDLKNLRRQYENNSCLSEYLRKSKGSDERGGFFGLMN
ncbi:MAG: hypothetical protein H0V66_02555 [Bdellovibrionales bacterium]|nr:hypothetical protein [Bdellovibrionales bacterium]